MPSEWRGKWFEAGIGDVTITEQAVLNKGECVDKVNDFYLLDNRCAEFSTTPRSTVDRLKPELTACVPLNA